MPHIDLRHVPFVSGESCTNKTAHLNIIRQTISPYLYPFAIEYSILIVGIWYIIFSHISNCPKKQSGLQTEINDHETIIPNVDVEDGHGRDDGKIVC